MHWLCTNPTCQASGQLDLGWQHRDQTACGCCLNIIEAPSAGTGFAPHIAPCTFEISRHFTFTRFLLGDSPNYAFLFLAHDMQFYKMSSKLMSNLIKIIPSPTTQPADYSSATL